ncbi:TerC family protein [Litchfieldella rifensis]|uniref:TerC family protein n=1 Tax=Litchfieldella rifensis TaxID=762643 RepID=A0ABV7LI76_9GAMM
MGESWWLWGVFALLVLAMLGVDLLMRGDTHKVSMKEAAAWSTVWVLVSLLFGAGLWAYLYTTQDITMANSKATEFLTGYLIEKSLSVDNVFVWLTLFSFFGISPELQRRVLIYGVLGAVVLRIVIILIGAWLVRNFEWVLYVFGAFLVFTGVKMAWGANKQSNVENNRLLRWMRGHLRITRSLHGNRFTIKEQGKRWATPLLVVLIMVEISDIIFAVDSIPAIFAITRDTFIVLTSNIFAVLGLRAMYFLFAGLAERFSLLDYGLALVLVFIGIKLLIEHWYTIPIGWSLAVVAVVVSGTMAFSWYWTDRHATSS